MQITSMSSANLHLSMTSFSSDINATFIDIVYKFPSLLSLYIHNRGRNSRKNSNLLTTKMLSAWQMATWKSNIHNSSTTESELWKNAGPSAYQCTKTMLKSDKIWQIWCSYLVINSVSLQTLWTPLVRVLCYLWQTKTFEAIKKSRARSCNGQPTYQIWSLYLHQLQR